VLQCVAVCCSVLQCVAVCCSVLQCVAVCCSVLRCDAAWCNSPSTIALSLTYGNFHDPPRHTQSTRRNEYGFVEGGAGNHSWPIEEAGQVKMLKSLLRFFCEIFCWFLNLPHERLYLLKKNIPRSCFAFTQFTTYNNSIFPLMMHVTMQHDYVTEKNNQVVKKSKNDKISSYSISLYTITILSLWRHTFFL